MFIVGDLNVRLDRTDDANSRQLTELLQVYGFAVGETDITHARDLTPSHVTVYDADLSDHHLRQWSVPATKLSSPVVSLVRRPCHDAL